VSSSTGCRIAAALGVSWHTVNDAVLPTGHQLLIADPTRFDGVRVLGVDEHAWRHTRRGDKFVTGWPPGMHVIARRQRPHPGAQLRIADHEGWRITMFATNTRGGRLAELELRHRRRARAEDRIRALKDTGMTNLPLQAFAKNQIWLELVQLAAALLTWTQLLAWPDQP
jgi:Transposase DDE domain group 1